MRNMTVISVLTDRNIQDLDRLQTSWTAGRSDHQVCPLGRGEIREREKMEGDVEGIMIPSTRPTRAMVLTS